MSKWETHLCAVVCRDSGRVAQNELPKYTAMPSGRLNVKRLIINGDHTGNIHKPVQEEKTTVCLIRYEEKKEVLSIF